MDLPWWKDLPEYDGVSWSENAMIRQYPGELREKIGQFPLTQQRTLSFLSNHVNRICLRNFPTCIIPSIEIPYKFDISINRNVNFNEKVEGFIHELIHGTYRAGSRSHSHCEEIEKIIQDETLRFHRENKSFSEGVLEKYFNGIK